MQVRTIGCFIAGAFIICCSYQLSAQKTTVYSAEIVEYNAGLELLDKEKFGAAQRQFVKAVNRINDPNSEISVNAQYYAALCALELFNKDAEKMFTGFVQDHPESPKVKTAYFQLGRYNYRKRKWQKAIEWFHKVDIYDLTNDELAEYYFKLGYSYFREEDYEKAGNTLFEIKDVDTKYTAPARYYYSHIAYEQGNFQTALDGFKRIEQHDKFAPIVPYYIAQIYYRQKKFEELIDYAPPLLDSSNTKRTPEIARLIGEAYYGVEKYAEAIPYLEKYGEKSYRMSREDKYQLGYAYYKSGDFEKAIDILKPLTAPYDAMSQAAYYHLADCYLNLDKKQFSRNAFLEASKMEFDSGIEEESLFCYAKLSYELGYDPHHNTVASFQEYIDRYPNSENAAEAYDYLINVFTSTKNYKAAITSLEQMPSLDFRLKGAYQLVAYNRAVELFHNQQFGEAVRHFEKVKTYPIDKKINALSYYWTGEAQYRMKNYPQAIENYQAFLYQPRAILQQEFKSAEYNIAYAYFELADYNNSITWFRKYIRSTDDLDSTHINDALLRIADGYFIQGDYNNAVDYYAQAINVRKLDTDYALYQRSMGLGILKKTEERVAALNELLTAYPGSNYLVDANYELGKSYFLKDEKQKALAYFNTVVEEYPNSSYVKKSLLNIGAIYRNSDQNDRALAIFQRIVHDYPTYEDSREALANIRNIHVETGRMDEYEDYIGKLAFANETMASLDSANYESAYLQYVNGHCERAKKQFESYLTKFQQPVYALNAHFYKAECEYGAREYEQALPGYNFVIDHPLNKFTETALLKASRINFNSQRNEDALGNYIMLEKIAEYKTNLLEARVGQMRCFHQLDNFDSAIEYCDKVLSADKVPNNIVAEAHLIKGRSALELDSLPMAMEEFVQVSQVTKSEMRAEAQYQIAHIHYLQKNTATAEAAIYELVNLVPSYEYWVAKGLILLADVYIDMEDAFQAKATLQSIIDNYEGDELKQLAQQKLDVILEAEEQEKEQPAEQENFEIDFDLDFDIDIDSLFEEETVEEELIGKKTNETIIHPDSE